MTHSSALVLRYRGTDIVWVAPSRRAFRLDTGPENPIAAARRMTTALRQYLAAGLPRPVVAVHDGRLALMLPSGAEAFATSISAVHNGAGWQCWPDAPATWRPYASPSPGGPAL